MIDEALDRNRMRLILTNAMDDLSGIKALLDWFRQRTKHDFDILWKSTFLSIEKITNKSMSLQSDKNRIFELERQLAIRNEKHDQDIKLVKDFMLKITKAIGTNNDSETVANDSQNIETILDSLLVVVERFRADYRKLTDDKHNLEIVAQMLNDETERLRDQNGCGNDSIQATRAKLNTDTLTVLPKIKFFEDRTNGKAEIGAKVEELTNNYIVNETIWNATDDLHEQLYTKSKTNLTLTNDLETLNLKLNDLESDLRCTELKCYNLTDYNRKLLKTNNELNDSIRQKDVQIEIKDREIESLQQQLTDKSLDYQSLETRWFDDKSTIETATKQYLDLKQQYDRVLNETTESNHILVEKLKSKDTELIELQEKYRAANDSMETEWNRLRARVDEQIAVKDTETAKAEKSIRNLTLELEQTRQQFRMQLHAVEYEKRTQQDELRQVLEKLTVYDRDKTKQADEIERLKSQLVEKQQDFDLLAKKLESYETDKMKLFEDFEKLVENLTASELQNAEFQKRVDELKANEQQRQRHEHDLTTRLHEQITESERLYESVRTCQQQVEKLEKSLDTLDHEKHQLRQQAVELEEFWRIRETHFAGQLAKNARKIQQLQNDRYNLEVCLSDAKQQVEEFRTETRNGQTRMKQVLERVEDANAVRRKLVVLAKKIQQVAGIRFDPDAGFESAIVQRKLHEFLSGVKELRLENAELKKQLDNQAKNVVITAPARTVIYKELLDHKETSDSTMTRQLESVQKQLNETKLQIATHELEKLQLQDQLKQAVLKLRKLERDHKNTDGFETIFEKKNNEIQNQKTRLELLQKNNEFLQMQVESLQNSFATSSTNNETNLQIVRKMKKKLQQTDTDYGRDKLFEPNCGRAKLAIIDEEEF